MPHPPTRTSRTLTRAAMAVLAGSALGFAILLTTGTGLTTVNGGRLGGDFPAFYGAGRIVAGGRAAALYDPAVQEAAQADLFPSGVAGRVHFAYPPFVALAYVPFTWLPFKAAYAVQVMLMAIAIPFAIVLIRRALPGQAPPFTIAWAAALSFYPMFRSVLGGQNTAASLLCAAGAAGALARGNALAAGLWTGAWLFKPQLALPVTIALVVRSPDRRRFLIGFTAMAAIDYAAGVLVGGWMWPLWWWRHGVVPFAVADAAVDRGNAISIPALAAGTVLQPLGWLAPALLLAAIVALAWRSRLPIVSLVAVAACAAVLASPHALYYDGGLSILAGFVVAAAAAQRRSMWVPVAAIWALAWLQPLRDALPVPPVTLAVVLSIVAVLARPRPDAAAS